MSVTDYYIIGNLTVPSSWIALIIAFVVAYGAVRIRFGKKNAELLSDAFFYLIIVWKLSVIILDFSSVIRSPLSIFYFHGGMVGYFLGIAVSGGKFLWDQKKGRTGPSASLALLTGAVLAQSVYQVGMVLLNEGEWVAQGTTIIGFIVFAVFFWMNSVKSSNWQVQLIVLFMAVHVFVASIQPGSLFSTPLVTTIIIGIYFAILFSKESRIESRTEEQL